MNLTLAKIEIREATLADAKLLSSLGAITFYEAYFEQDNPRDMADYLHKTYSVSQIEAELADPLATYYLMFRDGHAVGFAKLQRDACESCVIGEKTILLKRIYLVERVWGKGFGEVFLNHCIDIARSENCNSIWLDVWDQNPRAQKFYFKHGFERVGTLEFPYGDTVGINSVMERML